MRLALRDEVDRGAEADPLGDDRGRGQRHDRIDGARVFVGKVAAAGERRVPAERDVRVVAAEVQRCQPPVLDRAGEVDDRR
jgi:hypothetical protein